MREINYKPPSSSNVFRLGLWVLGALIALYVVFASWYIVDQGERAVVLRLGATVGEAGPGPHFKIPWVDTVRLITVQNQNRRYQALEAYSRDQQPANLTVSVTFVVSDPSAVYEQYGDLDGAVMRLVDPRVMSETKSIFGQYDAVRAIQERVALNEDFSQAADLARENPAKLAELQQIFHKEALRNHVFPIDDRRSERFNPSIAGRPDLLGGRKSLTVYPGMIGMMENAFINVKGVRHTITAEVVVPDAKSEGVIIAQAGYFGGWALYMKGGRVVHDYNYFGLSQTKVASKTPLAPGAHTIVYEFLPDEAKPGTGGKPRQPYN